MIIMTFLRGLKANVKPLFAARAYKSLTDLKSAIANYKQFYEENRETTYNLPMKWGTEENSPIHPARDKKIDVRPPESTRMKARPYWFCDRGDERRYVAPTRQEWRRADQGGGARPQPPASCTRPQLLTGRQGETQGGSSNKSTTRRVAAVR
ncbi:hypothetical protein EVAR_43961_1 [Eumeta japonica]|uniref:Uncharacterized protein n=1 Tax=Eumeta variegata TaxID=151549 RepID=A0A4C1XZH7_EUMVA|nr:hypothetical protein EVAR_43961_1 [Eumeta japonica]